MKTTLRVLACAAVTTVGGGVAFGQPMEMGDPDQPELATQYGMSATLGGGLVGFVDNDMTDFADVGGAWEVRVAFGTRLPIAGELAYTGGALSIDALGLDDDARLVSTGLEALARANLATGRIQPYAVAGVGWRRYDLTNTSVNTSAVTDQDDVMEIPLGVGLSYRYRGLIVDLRGAFRLAVGSDLVAATGTGGEQTLHTWDTTLRAGWEF